MALRNYWCVLTQRKKTAILGRVYFGEVTSLTCELDLAEGMGYTVRAAFFHGVTQHGGEDADAAEYRMDVYDSAGDEQPVLPGFTVPPDAAVQRATGSPADYGDDELIAELAQRLNGC
jgi:hypothetical protein